MKTLYVHVGLQKTGTSTIQMSFMRKNGPLTKAGIDFLPEAIAPRHAHHNAAWEIGGHRRFDASLPGMDVLRKAAEESGSDRLFISTEEFSLIKPGQIAQFVRRMDGFDVRPILCLRNQLNWSESLFAQACKRGYPNDFQTYGATLAEVGRLDFNSVIDPWVDACGADKVSLLIYEEHDDITGALAGLLGLSMAKPPARKNQSLNERFVWASQKLMNTCRENGLSHEGKTIPPKMLDAVAKSLLAVGTRHPQFEGSPVFLDHAAGQSYLDAWADVNNRISRLVDLPSSYFHVPEDRRLPQSPVLIDTIVLKDSLFAAPEIEKLLEDARED